MTVNYRINVRSMDRWSGPEFWTEDFDTMQDAKDKIKWYNDRNTEKMAPEYYEQAELRVMVVEA